MQPDDTGSVFQQLSRRLRLLGPVGSPQLGYGILRHQHKHSRQSVRGGRLQDFPCCVILDQWERGARLLTHAVCRAPGALRAAGTSIVSMASVSACEFEPKSAALGQEILLVYFALMYAALCKQPTKTSYPRAQLGGIVNQSVKQGIEVTHARGQAKQVNRVGGYVSESPESDLRTPQKTGNTQPNQVPQPGNQSRRPAR